MKFTQVSKILIIFSSFALHTVQAEEPVLLPSIQAMAESEMRDEEVGIVPYQEDSKVRKALQHHVNKSERDIQNYVVNDNIKVIDFQPSPATPDMSNLSPALQQYVLAIAAGLKSSDPSNGLFNMLEPLGINRGNADALRNGTLKLNIDMDNSRLQQILGPNWKQNK
ncbi:hypothetical protein RFI36_16740 [Acinetobacter gerneri]|uniref:Uncharacterized protein n=1 Tax=Acinetobacter gerneri TaxID=202952 RepID=A0AAW8JNH2_9GAMM|nr:hypothetical protein [Acinetobacter gerneri]MDQ9011348.1 hypothetical protein [Acinetobacter gerneri]MDQ9015484.1 hypothetical protein [Acinetobacter gerneri]MDQ9026685.1 hypothetical protein [Acinetobacter gerneri]MDQ9053966.1 hypothetical protein [Acinetobacter gerneri]MDQ9061636.1 hypothetical protein [Acinetobacter gerneri]